MTEGQEAEESKAQSALVLGLHDCVQRLERIVDPARAAVRDVERGSLPAWRRVTEGESRGPVTLAMAVAIVLMSTLHSRVANHPQWLLPGVAGLLLVALIVANPRRIDRSSRALRVLGLVLIGVLSVANASSAVRLVLDLVRGLGIRNPPHSCLPALRSGSRT